MNRLLALEVQQPNLVGAFQQGRQAKQQNRLMDLQTENAGLQNEALRGEPERRQQAIKRKAEINLVGHLVEALGQTDNLNEKAQLYTQALEVGDRMKLDMADLPREYKPEFEQMLRIQSGAKDFEFKEPKAEAKTNIEKLLNAKALAEQAGDTQRVQVLDNAIQKATTPTAGTNVTVNNGSGTPQALPKRLLENLPDDIAAKAEEAFILAGGGKDGVKALQSVVTSQSAGDKDKDKEFTASLGKLRDSSTGMQNVTSLLKDDLFESLYGSFEGADPTNRFSAQRKDAVAIRDQLVGLLSLESRQKLKGQGTITDSEAKTLEKSSTILANESISETLAKKELNKVFKIFRSARNRSIDLPDDVSWADIETTATENNMTQEEVIQRLLNGR